MSHKIYFASDFHLGSPSNYQSFIREKKICSWLNSIANDAKAIYLVGDIFDFWFEYKTVIPKGFERIKGTICQLTDKGVEVHFFPGNHDLWTFDYLESELGVIVHRKPLITEINGKTFYISHGDGLGKGDIKYKLIRSVFRSRICQYLFGLIHPNIGIWIAQKWSAKSRKNGGQSDKNKLKNNLIKYSKNILAQKNINYFIYGHIHEPAEIELSPESKYINLGDWIKHFSYVEFHESNLLFKYF